MEKLLEALYYTADKPQAYSSIEKLYEHVKRHYPKARRYDVVTWLQKQESYTLHKQPHRTFKHRIVYVTGIDDQFQIDLCDMRSINKDNDGYNYILTCIDVFSKFAWAIPVRVKRPSEVAAAFLQILNSGRKPRFVQSDKGTEFLGRPFQQMLKDHNIEFFTSENPDIKCSVVERFNRTLKTRMWKAFTHQRNRRWIEILPLLVSAYNNSLHRSIGVKPIDVSSVNEDLVRQKLYGDGPDMRQQRFKFNVGDQVRVLRKHEAPFRKGYEPQWTEEVFVVHKRLAKYPPVYVITDYNNEPIKGTYYAYELQRVIKEVEAPYWVEKILKTRRDRSGQLQYFVKWSGYSNEFNQWISEKDLRRV